MKLSQIYHQPSFMAFLDAGKQFLDAATSGLGLARNLEVIDPTIFQVVYPENVFLNSGLEVNNVGGYANTLTSLRARAQGSFKRAGDQTSDKGRITISGESSSIPVEERTANISWNDTDVKQGQLFGRNIVAESMQAADEIYKRELDEFAATGIDGDNGLLNHSSLTASTKGSITSLSGLEMYDLFAGIIIDQHVSVNNIPAYMATKMILPINEYNLIQKTILNSAADRTTVLSALNQNFPGIDIMYSHRCNSVSSLKTGVFYNPGKEVLKFRLPVPMMISPTAQTGFEYTADAKYRCAGVDLLEAAGVSLFTLGSAS